MTDHTLYSLAYKVVSKDDTSVNIQGIFSREYKTLRETTSPHPSAPLLLFSNLPSAVGFLGYEHGADHIYLCLCHNQAPLPPWRDIINLNYITDPSQYNTLTIFSTFTFPSNTVAFHNVIPLREVHRR